MSLTRTNWFCLFIVAFASLVWLTMPQQICQAQDQTVVHPNADSAANPEDSIDGLRMQYDKTGDANAARSILKQSYIGRKFNSLTDAERDDFGKLLESVHAASPDDQGIVQTYADYLIATGRLAESVPVLEKLAVKQPMRGLQAAAILQKLGGERTIKRVRRTIAGCDEEVK